MERRGTAAIVAAELDRAGVSDETAAEAAGISVSALKSCLLGEEDFEVEDIAGIGGLLRVSPSQLIGATRDR